MTLDEQQDFFKRNCSISDFLLQKEKEWTDLFLEIMHDLEAIRKDSFDKDSQLEKKFDQLKYTLKESLNFVNLLIEKEIDRTDEQDDYIHELREAVGKIESWRAETQELIAEIQIELSKVSEKLDNLKKEEFKKFNDSLESMHSTIKILGEVAGKRIDKQIDWTKVILACISGGGILYLILDKLM